MEIAWISIEGSVVNRSDVQKAMTGCDVVYINLTQDTEFIAMQHVLDKARNSNIERITYVSATTAYQEKRWFDLMDIKMRTEELIQQNGVANIIFCWLS